MNPNAYSVSPAELYGMIAALGKASIQLLAASEALVAGNTEAAKDGNRQANEALTELINEMQAVVERMKAERAL